jgi:hypothetical protein
VPRIIDQGLKGAGCVCVASVCGPLKCGLGVGELAALREKETKPAGGSRVSKRIRGAVCLLSAGRIANPLQQCSEVERPVWLTPIVGSAVARLRVADLAALLQEHAEVECSRRVAARIGLAIGLLGRAHVAALLEQQREVETLDGVAGPVPR